MLKRNGMFSSALKATRANSADMAINKKDKSGKTPLIRAAEEQRLEDIRDLLNQGADICLTYSYPKSVEYINAIGMAYLKYSEVKAGADHQKTEHAKNCLELLIQAAQDYLYQKGKAFNGPDELLEIYLATFSCGLAGMFNCCSNQEASSLTFSDYLEHQVLQPVVTQMQAERVFMLSFIRTCSEGRDLGPEILSYLHTPMPHGVVSLPRSENTPSVAVVRCCR